LAYGVSDCGFLIGEQPALPLRVLRYDFRAKTKGIRLAEVGTGVAVLTMAMNSLGVKILESVRK